MIGLGTIINTAAIIIGGILGIFLKNAFSERIRDTLIKACGISVLFLGIGGAMEEMLVIAEKGITTQGSMMLILCFIFGSLVGELISIEGKIEIFGNWLKRKSGSEKDNSFLDGFLTTSFTVCIGAMAVVGALEDGINGDYSLLLAKSLLDFIIVIVMTAAMGKGCIFSAIPVAILQGSVTLLAKFIQPLMTDMATSNLSLTGSVLIFCVGVNLVWGKKVKVANMLPTIIFAVAYAFIG